MSDSHDHGDHAGHHHGEAGHGHSAPARFGTAFAIGIALNMAYVAIEAAFGVASNSLALLADAGHNLSDVLGLAVSWAAAVLSMRPPSRRFTYGLRGSSILAALFNSGFLLLTFGAIGWESLQRLFHPQPVVAVTVMIVAAAGLVVNGVTAWLFASGRKGDLNIRGAFLHMASDAVVSAGVVAAGLVIVVTGWLWLDPLVSLVVAAVVVGETWGLMRESLAMSLAAVPSEIAPAEVKGFLTNGTGVSAVHDLHIWPMSTTEVAMTAHLVMPGGHPGDEVLFRVESELQKRFGIGHDPRALERPAPRREPSIAAGLQSLSPGL
jgi:cobalt-zinc-cadmium efflux system protein